MPESIRSPLTDRSRCGIHGDPTGSGRCASCDALREFCQALEITNPRDVFDHDHNSAVSRFAGTGSALSDEERGILSLLFGMAELARTGTATDEPFGVAEVWGPLFDGANTALNFELGRLRGGPLSSFLAHLSRRVGRNPDTGEYIPADEMRFTRADLHRFTLADLAELPTLAKGQADNLKVDTGEFRVWLCRCGVADGMPCDNLVTVERLTGDGWVTIDAYEAR